MNAIELEGLLVAYGFKEMRQDTGCGYTRTVGPVELICYVEPGIDIVFTTIFSWDDNDVKGDYNVSVKELKNDKDSLVTMFRKTKNNLPQYIGEDIDTHKELEAALRVVFDY